MMIKIFDKKLVLFNKMVLFDSAKKEDGYVSNINRTDLLGKEGIALPFYGQQEQLLLTMKELMW